MERGGGGLGVIEQNKKTLYLQTTEASNRTKRTINNRTEEKKKKGVYNRTGIYTRGDGRPPCQTRAQ